MRKKIIAIRNLSEKTWHKVRVAALKEKKTVGSWLTEFIEKHLKNKE